MSPEGSWSQAPQASFTLCSEEREPMSYRPATVSPLHIYCLLSPQNIAEKWVLFLFLLDRGENLLREMRWALTDGHSKLVKGSSIEAALNPPSL